MLPPETITSLTSKFLTFSLNVNIRLIEVSFVVEPSWICVAPTCAVMSIVGGVVSTTIWLDELILFENIKSDISFPAISTNWPELKFTCVASRLVELSPDIIVYVPVADVTDVIFELPIDTTLSFAPVSNTIFNKPLVKETGSLKSIRTAICSSSP